MLTFARSCGQYHFRCFLYHLSDPMGIVSTQCCFTFTQPSRDFCYNHSVGILMSWSQDLPRQFYGLRSFSQELSPMGPLECDFQAESELLIDEKWSQCLMLQFWLKHYGAFPTRLCWIILCKPWTALPHPNNPIIPGSGQAFRVWAGREPRPWGRGHLATHFPLQSCQGTFIPSCWVPRRSESCHTTDARWDSMFPLIFSLPF